MNPIINLADHLPRMTAEDLMAEAKRYMTEDTLEFEEFLFSLPKYLKDCLELGMSGMDYLRMKDSEIAEALRILAMLAVTFDSYLGTSLGRASCRTFADNPLDWCLAILKSMRLKQANATSLTRNGPTPAEGKVVRLTRPCK